MNLRDFVEPGDSYINFETGERVSGWAAQYTGQEDAIIAFGTDVWLQNPAGEKVNLMQLRDQRELVQHSCREAEDFVDGAIAPINDDYGIERCDACNVFEGDFDAARAVADKLGGDLTIWYHPSPKENQ